MKGRQSTKWIWFMINTRFKQNAKLPLTSTWHVSQDCKARLSLVGRLSQRARCDKDSKVWEDKIMSLFFSCNHPSIPVHAADWLAPSSSTCATWTPIWIHFREQLADVIPQRNSPPFVKFSPVSPDIWSHRWPDASLGHGHTRGLVSLRSKWGGLNPLQSGWSAATDVSAG